MTPRAAIRETEFLVLRRTPYSDTSLIVTGLSPEDGLLKLVVRGGRRISRTKTPVVDLFRLLRVTYRPAKGDLHTLRDAELVRVLPGLSRDLETLRIAGWVAAFLRGNVMEGAPVPHLFTCAWATLERLELTAGRSDASVREAVAIVGVGLVYLLEGGWLSAGAMDTRSQAQCHELVQMAEDATVVAPHLTEKSWQRLQQWVVGLLRNADCRLPGSS